MECQKITGSTHFSDDNYESTDAGLFSGILIILVHATFIPDTWFGLSDIIRYIISISLLGTSNTEL